MFDHAALASSPAASFVSKRGLEHGLKPVLRYAPAIIKALEDLYHPITNPEGHIIMTLAENVQMMEEMMQKYPTSPPVEFSQLQLGDFNGSPQLKEGIRKLVKRELSSHIQLNDDHILCLSGAAAVMITTSCALFNPGESLLILAPCYPGFFPDFGHVGGVHCAPVRLAHPDYRLEIQKLEVEYGRAHMEGHPPRAVLLTNPSNPNGRCYSREELTALLRWVREKKLFLISSEVYGVTFFEGLNGERAYISMIDIAYEEAQRANGGGSVDLSTVLSNDIQILWSASKDMGLSGIRVGASICQNPMVHLAMTPFGISGQIGREAQHTVAYLLNDENWIAEYFRTMRTKLRQAASLVETTFDTLEVPYVKPEGGLHVWFDLKEFLPLYYHRRLLKSSSQHGSMSQPAERDLEEAEWDMFEDIFFNYRLGLTPGTDFAPSERAVNVQAVFGGDVVAWHTSAGFMRICFASLPIPFIPVAMQRLTKFILDRRAEIQNLK